MKLGIMQPYFFPYIGYWQLIHEVDRYVICDDVNYIKNKWINKNFILINGANRPINLKIRKASQNKLINDLEVLNDHIWSNNFLKTIKYNYKKAPHFEACFSVIERIISHDEKNLAKYLEFGMRQICDYLSIDTEIIVSSKIHKSNGLKGKDKVIEICKLLGGDKYINAIGGQKLYFREDFAAQGIELKFLKTSVIEYRQFNDIFIPNLSILDVIMSNSKDEVNNLLDRYELVEGLPNF